VATASAVGGVLFPIAAAGTAQAAGRETTTVRVSAPDHAVEPGRAPVSVRLLSGGRYVHNAVVDLQVPTGHGWRTVGHADTGAYGLGHTTIPVTKDTRVRAYYRGAATRGSAKSASDVIDVETFGQRVVSEASKHRGAPYRYGAAGPSAFDCSGFTEYVFGRFGKRLPHNARGQRNMAQAVDRSDIRIGDLVFLDGAGHVGIYAGNGEMWDSPRSGKTVTLRQIYSTNYTVGRVYEA
jgi:cell wall-associated NlpC family hydrolase